MRVLLIDIDSKIPNLALKKIEKYHIDRGDEVIWNFPLMKDVVDYIYVSCIFKKNKEKCYEWNTMRLLEKVTIGGSGWSLDVKLPDDIEKINPRINLGFLTRGCIRKCPFCIVWKKEPTFERVANILDLWDGKSYFINKRGKKERTIITLLDNNILADFDWFKLNCELAQKNKLKIDFNQGLDCRLLTKDITKILKKTSHIEYRFSFDNIEIKPNVDKAIKLLKDNKINRCNWYVLVGYKTTFEEDLFRLNFLRDRNQNAYVQRYNFTSDKKYIPLARWANQHHIFQGMTWEQFLNRPENKKYKELFV